MAFINSFILDLFISPVVYCYYLQYNPLSPGKIVAGKDHVNGGKFILLNQRWSGLAVNG
ncbi:MAG: hypothetical protein IPK57_15575 [Chitinophagaceae bacterium]|nr:hypothetical protein [Chitinophagaceae bacterium]